MPWCAGLKVGFLAAIALALDADVSAPKDASNVACLSMLLFLRFDAFFLLLSFNMRGYFG